MIQVIHNDRICVQKAIWAWLCVAFLLILGSTAAFAKPDQLPQPGIQGYVDFFVVEGDKVVAQGWVGVADPIHKVVSLSVWLANVQIYEGSFERFERPDTKLGWKASRGVLRDVRRPLALAKE